VFTRTVETTTKTVGSVPTPTTSGAGEVGNGVTAILISRDVAIENPNVGLPNYSTLIVSKKLTEVFELVQLLGGGASVSTGQTRTRPRGARGG